MGRLEGKVAAVIGAGQNPGDAIGNGRAASLRYVQEGASLLAVDRNLQFAKDTAESVPDADCLAFEADVTESASIEAAIDSAIDRWGRIDVLHYNVGLNVLANDAPLDRFSEDAFDRVLSANLRGFIMAAKHVEPIMRRQESGVVIGISSMSSIETTSPFVAYRVSKAGMNAFIQQFAIRNAEFGIRANAILPGRIDTATSVDARAKRTGRDREELVAERNRKTPLKRVHPTAWDVANAALFLASDEARFITGVCLPVDGGTLVRIG